MGIADASPFPAAVLEKLAGRFRAAGLCLVAMKADGSVAAYDPVAGAFFARYVLPLIRDDAVLAEKTRRLSADSAVTVFDSVPGVVLAVCPYAERKQVIGAIALAAKAETFSAGESVLRACTAKAIDATWLGQRRCAARLRP